MTSTLYRGGVVDAPEVPGATSLLVADRSIAWVGGTDQADGLALAADRVVDLDGALVTAGFVDAHVHVLSTALRAEGVDLAGSRSVDEALAAVRAAVAEHGVRLAVEGAPLTGHAWDEQGWAERRAPTRHELDAAGGGAPVYLARVDLHSAVVSTSFAQVLGLDRLPGWHEDGTVTGEAFQAARDAVADVEPARRDRLYRVALEQAARAGVVAVHEHSTPDGDTRDGLAALLAMSAEPASGLPLVVGYRAEECADTDQVREVLSAVPGLTGVGGDLMVDGSVGSRTAALHLPYADLSLRDAHPAGVLAMTADRVRAQVVAATLAGVPTGFHVAGDRAMAEVLAGFHAAVAEIGLEPVRGAGHRVEHAELLDAPALAGLVLVGVTVSVQPGFDAAWGGGDGMYSARLGRVRAAVTHPLADLHAAGVPLALGSDSPVTAVDPWSAVRAAVLHRSVDQRIGVRAAVQAHTVGGWAAAGVPDGAGRLRAGAPAHLAVWDVDPAARGRGQVGLPTWRAAGRTLRDPVLPDLSDHLPAPRCMVTVRSGVHLHDLLA